MSDARKCDACGQEAPAEAFKSLKSKDRVLAVCPTCYAKAVARAKQKQQQQAESAAPAKPKIGGKVPSGSPPARKRPAGGGAGAPRRVPRSGARAAAGAAPAPGKKGPARKPTVGGKRPVRGSQREPVAATVDGDEGPRSFQIKKKSNALLYTILAVIGVGFVAFVMIILNKEKPKPPPKIDPQVVAAKRREEQKRAEEATAEEQFQLALEFANNNPDELPEARYNFRAIYESFRSTAAGAKAQDELNKLISRHRQVASERWAKIQNQVQGGFASEQFAAAWDAIKEQPEVIASLGDEQMQRDYRELHRLARSQFEAYEEFFELRGKSIEYADMGYGDIGVEIVSAFNERYQEDAPDVWKLKEETVLGGEAEIIRNLQGLANAATLAKREKEKAAEDARNAKREALWLGRVGSVNWWSHLGPYDLFNWVIDSDRYLRGDSRWRVRKDTVDGVKIGVLTGENKSGDTMFLGPFTDHWQDYVLEFECKVFSGSLQLSPRTKARTNGAVGSVTDVSDYLEFGEETGYPTGKWIKVRIEVRGNEVTLDANGETKTLGGEDDEYRLPVAGGFCFYLPKDSRAEVRGVRTKLIVHNRERLF